jgi:outer membrane lipoprotein-sorting protein
MDEMKKVRRFLHGQSILVILVWSSPLWAAEDPTLDEILSRMDAVGAKLSSMRSEIHQKKWTAILEEFDDGEKGYFSFLKTDQGVYLRKDIVEPTSNTLVIKEGTVIFFQPSIKQAQKYNMGSHGDKAEFLLLGFGSDRKALRETYQIELLGKEEFGERTTYQVELTPKSESVAAFFTSIVLWVDDQLWVPIQEKLVEPTEDYLLIRFSEVDLDAKLSKSDFEVKLPKDVKVIQN